MTQKVLKNITTVNGCKAIRLINTVNSRSNELIRG